MEETATGCLEVSLEVTCLKCKASMHVTAHRVTNARASKPNVTSTTNQFTIKKSMHEPSCLLFKEPAKQITMAKLPSIGTKVTVYKDSFAAKGI